MIIKELDLNVLDYKGTSFEVIDLKIVEFLCARFWRAKFEVIVLKILKYWFTTS